MDGLQMTGLLHQDPGFRQTDTEICTASLELSGIGCLGLAGRFKQGNLILEVRYPGRCHQNVLHETV